MRHIPEEELHAYLDQALSRSQCVEIESHLADCLRCRASRDEIAALRDRTTALLAGLGPLTIPPPPFEVIRALHDRARQERRRWLGLAAWAASVLLAVAAGWQANHWIDGSSPPAVATTPSSTNGSTAMPITTRPIGSGDIARASGFAEAHPRPVAPRSASLRRDPVDGTPVASTAPAVGSATAAQAPPGTNVLPVAPVDGDQLSLEVSSLRAPSSLGELDGVWRTVPLAGDVDGSGTQVPHVAGLPVMQVRIQKAHAGGDVTAVEQQLASGEVIQTIEGPASRVSDLISRHGASPSDSTGDTVGRNGNDMTLTVRQGDRMLAVTGPSAVLGSLMSRVSLRRRY